MGSAVDEETAETVADLLECVDLALDRIEAEAERVLATRAANIPVPTLARFLRLVEQVRPAAQARADLVGVDPEVLLAGALTLQGRRGGEPRAGHLGALRVSA